MESWTEIRCPACVELGWRSSRLLLKVQGRIPELVGVTIELKCHRCKSLISWRLGTPVLIPITMGVKNHKQQTVAFE